MIGRRRPGDDENAGADDLADAEHDEARWSERAMKLMLVSDNGIGLREIREACARHAVTPPAVSRSSIPGPCCGGFHIRHR